MYDLIISLPFFTCLFGTVELILCLKTLYNRPRAWLLPWTVATTLLYGSHYIFFSKGTWLLPVTDTIYSMCNLAVYPLYLLYIRELTNHCSYRESVRWLLYIIIPIMLAAAAMAWIYAEMSENELKLFCDGYLYATNIDTNLTGWAAAQAMLHNVCRAIFCIQVIVTAFLGMRWIKAYNDLISQLYADTEDKEMSNIAILFNLLLLTSVMSVVVNALGRSHFFGQQWIALPALCFSVLLYAIGYVGRRQDFSIEDIADEEDTTTHITPEAEDSHSSHIQHELATADIILRLHQLVDEKQMYLQPNLKLDDLTRSLNTNRTYLLKAMKQELQMTFTEYINRKRIVYAQHLMQQHPDMSKTEIAERSGYASTSSFYRCLRMFGTSQ
ncbi:MAG: helix-turn-helix transcriptional regulator [Bacteroidaceae bacterium]|nr:helix-turn-helix transcriptional regulator [Bacteroidaceae bacterium]